jgi:uncharacterized membrane protein YidH (DUF202 family)
MNRVVAGLAIVMAILFASVSFEEPEFLLIHCFEGSIYIVIVALLYYSREEWAYPLGMILPLVWIILSYATGRLSAGVAQVGMVVGRREISNFTSLLAVALTIGGLALVVASAYYYYQEIHGGSSGGPKNFGLAALISLAYYAVLVLWFTAAVS